MQLVDDGFSLGIVTCNSDCMLGFYRDVLRFESEGTVSFPDLGTVHKLRHGSCRIKILVLESDPRAANPGGGFSAATGFRYCSFVVNALETLVEKCREAGCQVSVEPKQIRPGVVAAVILDPDGNTIELMQMAA